MGIALDRIARSGDRDRQTLWGSVMWVYRRTNRHDTPFAFTHHIYAIVSSPPFYLQSCINPIPLPD
jgi:hypothetical protein